MNLIERIEKKKTSKGGKLLYEIGKRYNMFEKASFFGIVCGEEVFEKYDFDVDKLIEIICASEKEFPIANQQSLDRLIRKCKMFYEGTKKRVKRPVSSFWSTLFCLPFTNTHSPLNIAKHEVDVIYMVFF